MPGLAATRTGALSRLGARLRSAATHDFCPAVSRRVRRAVHQPLGMILLAAGVAALCGLAVHPRVFALAGGLLAVAAAGVCWPWLTVRGVRAAVRYDRDRAVEGAEVGVSAAVTNHLPWPAWGLGLRQAPDEPVVGLPGVGGRTRAVCRWVWVPPARGEYPAAPPAVVTGFPFGVWEAGRAAAVEGRLVVWPRTFPVGPVPAAGGDEAEGGTPARGRVGTTGEVVGVRPYRRGDSPRRIHWPQSAKHDRLVVCELQPTARPAVLVVLDTDPAAHTPGPDGSFEWAVRVAASLARGWLEDGAAVGLAWAGGVVPVNAGAAQVGRVMDALARVGGGDRPLADVLASPAVRAARVGVRVVVTTDAGAARAGPGGGVRWAVLRRAGFQDCGMRNAGCGIEEGNRPGPSTPHSAFRIPHFPRPWLDIPSAADAPHRLRHGTPEATHGS
jgi:uncharacterized protein (DUF58 family)